RGCDAQRKSCCSAQRGTSRCDRLAPSPIGQDRHVNVIPLPASLDERTFDQVVRAVDAAEGARVLFDATHVRWVDPYGMVGLLCSGSVAKRNGELPLLKLPDNPDVVSYLTRMHFFPHAEAIFELSGTPQRKSG